MSDFHVADLTVSGYWQRKTHSLSPSSRLSFLASGYGALPSGLRCLVTVTAGVRCGLIQSAARSDRGSAAPGPHTTHLLIAPPFASTVSRSATDQDIRKAYKRLSKKYHPDKNQSPGAEEKFVEVAHGTMNALSYIKFRTAEIIFTKLTKCFLIPPYVSVLFVTKIC